MSEQARVVVIGGGVVGCGLAYHLTKLGWNDVLLLEKNELTAGASWHAAGHVMHYASSALLTRMQKETTDLLPQLEAETGQSVGFHRTGALRLITTDDQVTEYRRAVAKAAALDMEMDIVSPERARELFPLMSTHGLRGALWTPGDGHCDPSGVTFAYARGARAGGARIRTGCQVTGLRWTGSEWQVDTTQGQVTAEYVVNCAGMWAQEIANMVGVTLPLIVFMHQHLVTEDHPAVAALERELVLIRDSGGGYNCRQEGRGLLSGVYEHAPDFVFVDGIPQAFGRELMAPDFDRSADFIARAIERVPALGEVGIKMVYNGPTSRTPDHQPLFGPVPGLHNHFIAAGYAAGFVQAGFTRYVAQWIAEGEPELDLSELHVARFGVHADRAYAFDVVRAAHAFSNTPAYPHAERRAGRPAQTGVLYDRQHAAGACFGVRAGVEVVNWYAPAGVEAVEQARFGRPAWHDVVGVECHAVSTAAGLFDLADRYTFEVVGETAAAFLERVLASPLPGPGASLPALLPTRRGTVASLLWLARPASDRFVLVGPGEHRAWDLDVLRNLLGADEAVQLADHTGATVRLLLSGPAARAVLDRAAGADLAAPAPLPDRYGGLLHLDYVPTVAAQVDETGLDDWLLVAPAELARRLHDVLHRHSGPAGLRNTGLRALDALRLEAGEPVPGVDVDRTMTPHEAGLAHWLRPALRTQAAPPSRRRVLLSVEAADADAYRNDPVLAGGRAIGLVGSGGFGFHSGLSLAQALLPAEHASPGNRLAIEILGQHRAATVLQGPPGRALRKPAAETAN